ncbi:MAG TPA: Hsp20/alpha crystallin family protein [Actinomycetota bacterium]|nr:Hsp20/alpha crystallin family protein [Actinomycetota bacterium]
MAMSRWDPFRELASIQDELNRLFGRTYGTEGGEDQPDVRWVPALDVYESPDRFVITVELPGVTPDQVDISVENSTLTVRGERKFYDNMAERDFHRIERRFGSFGRSVSLPQVADAERIEASFDAGVLRIEVPKREEAKPRKIQVKARA